MANNKAIRKAANAFSAEGELRNVNDYLKDVARSFESHVKSREQANKSIITWTQRKKEDAAIREFITALGELFGESDVVDRRYNDHFKLFGRLWKGVLAEKKELNTMVSALKKARSNLDSARKKAQKAELKDPRDETAFQKAKKTLEETEAFEAEVRRGVDGKLFDVQQDKHNSLRTGYTGLYVAFMSRLKELTHVYERIRVLVNAFPRVKERKDDGSFVLEPFSGPDISAPIWARGEELHAELQAIQKKHQDALAALQAQHEAALNQILQDRERDLSKKSQSFDSELTQQDAAHKQLMQTVKASHQQALQTMEDRQQQLQSEYQKSLEEWKSRYEHARAELEERQKELLAHIADESRLEEQIELMKSQIASRAIRQAGDSINHASVALNGSCMENMLQRASAIPALLSGVYDAVTKGETNEVFAHALLSFSNAVVDIVHSANGAARASRAENSGDLLPKAVAFRRAAEQVLTLKQPNTPQNKSSDMLADTDAAAEEAKQKMVALYAHTGRVQDGFTLIGFQKGATLELLKKREDGWSRVRCGEDEGWAPTSYMRPLPEKRVSKAVIDVVLTPEQTVEKVTAELDELIAVGRAIQKRDKELAGMANRMADDLGSKVSAAEQAVLDALNHIQKLSDTSRATDRDRTLEVNQSLLEVAKSLYQHILELIRSAESMRAGLQATKGGTTDSEFNQKHKQWFQGLTKAVDTIGEGTPMLTEAMRCVVGKKGKHEEFQVATRNIAAAVAQLAALSKTKSLRRGDTSLEKVTSTSESLISTSHELLACIRESQEVILASVLLQDFDNLSETEAKRLVMATQVNVLKLESELTKEREKLGRLRRLNYEAN